MRTVVLTICLTVIMFSSTAVAIMGPPTATLKDDQYDLGVDFSKFDFETLGMPRTTTMTLKTQLYSEWTTVSEGEWVFMHDPNDQGVWTYLGDVIKRNTSLVSLPVIQKKLVSNMRGFNTTTTMFRYSGGLYDNFNVDVCIGGSKLNSDEIGRSTNVCGGAGVRINLYQKKRYIIGTSIQWRRFGWREKLDDLVGAKWAMDYDKLTFAIGPTYEIADDWIVYGGPYWGVVKGAIEVDADISDASVEYDDRDVDGYGEYGVRTSHTRLKTEAKLSSNEFGIVLGTEFILNKQMVTRLEANLTKEHNTLGASAVYRF